MGGKGKLAILEKKIMIGLATNFKFWEKLGYEIPREKNKWGAITIPKGTKLLVNVNDLPKGSNVKVTKICDDCGKESFLSYEVILRQRQRGQDEIDRCVNCFNSMLAKKRKENVEYKKSLEYYALKNNKEYLLHEYSQNNIKRPHEISRGTSDEFLWICQNCKSEYPLSASNRTNPSRNCNCPFCAGKKVNDTNSLLANFPEVANEWHTIKNEELTPNNTTYGSSKKVWWKCSECNNEWKTTVANRIKRGSNCPACAESKGEKRIRKWLEENKIKFVAQKEFYGLLGTGGGMLSYDFYLPKQNILMEYQGGFHDGSGGGYTVVNLENQQEHDQRKRKYTEQHGIELLEIWYWDFDNIEDILNQYIEQAN